MPPTDGPIPPEWYCQLAWPARALSGEQKDVDSSWLVVADSELGAEIGRVLGDDSAVTVAPSSLLAEGTDATALTDALAGATHCLRTAGVVWPFRCRIGIWLVQCCAEADRSADRNGGGAAAVPAHPQCSACR